MCGICGFAAADPTAPVERSVIESMMEVLRHRGPDGEGVHVAPGVGLGVRRLSIVDLETGDQPIGNEDGTVMVVCNGEIYNAVELRADLLSRGHRFRSRSDVEVIVHLYEERGPDLVDGLRGMFGLALWDARRRRLLLARDRLGIKPLLVAHRGAGLWFASEAKAIVAGAGLEARADPGAVRDLFRLGFVTGERTLFEGIAQLRPGCVASFEDGRLLVRRYWTPPPNRGGPRRSAGEWVEAVAAKLDETVRIHLRSDVPVGAWLSSGIDSSALTALAYRALGRPLETVTMAVADRWFDETAGRPTLDMYDGFDLPNTRITCDDRGFTLYPLSVWHAEQPSTHCIEIGRMILGRATAGRVKAVLTGEGADELFYGYRYFTTERKARPFTLVPRTLLRGLVGVSGLAARRPRGAQIVLAPPEMGPERYRALVGPLQSPPYLELLSPELRERVAGTEDDDLPAPPGGSSLDALADLSMASMLPDLIVHTLDRGAMAFGVEARVPFLDHELVELVAAAPRRLKLRGRTEKYLLREAVKGVVPDEIRQRRKRAPTVPFERWLARPLPPFAAELLAEGSLRDKGYFDPTAVAALLADQRAGRRLVGSTLIAVLGLQVWDELFVRGRTAAELSA